MSEPPDEAVWTDEIEVAISPAAAEYVRDRGCRLYVWGVEAGPDLLLKAGLEAPSERSFRRTRSGTLEVFVDGEFEAPLRLRVELRHLPWTHLTAISDDATGGGPTG